MPEPGSRPRVVVVGDVIVDVVLAPATELAPGTDVPGRVMLRQGGSATTTARWLGRSGLPVALVGAVGRDAAGCALVRAIRQDGVTTQAPSAARCADHALLGDGRDECPVFGVHPADAEPAAALS